MRQATWLGLILACALVGCDGDDAAPPVSQEDFCARVASANCKALLECCSLEPQRVYSSLAECLAGEKPSCDQNLGIQLGTYVGGFGGVGGAGGVDGSLAVEFDEQAAGEIVAALDTLAASCSVKPIDESQFDEVVHGTIATGGACMVARECADDANGCYSDTVRATQGTCGPQPGPSPEGGPCGAGTGRGCQDGLLCATDYSGGTPTATCVPRGDAGATCTSNNTCLATLRCVYATYYDGSGTCQAPLGEDADCGEQPSRVDPCADGFYCDYYGSCVPTQALGASCDGPEECASGYCEDGQVCGSCARDLDCADYYGIGGACVAGVCDPNVEPDLSEPIQSGNKADGSACDYDAECRSQWCTSGVCITPTANDVYCD